MSVISNSVLAYYKYHFGLLNRDQQFHFASRLYLWMQDPDMYRELDNLRGWYTADNNPEHAIDQSLANTLSGPFGSNNVRQMRNIYFKRYPELNRYLIVLFKILFLKSVFGFDCRNKFYHVFKESEVEDMAARLLNDRDAIAFLSSHAVNFLYLYNDLIKDDAKSLPVNNILNSTESCYDLQDKLQLQLYLYLHTHCIIAHSQYYYRPLNSLHHNAYHHMFKKLEVVISDRYKDINLDNKLEYLVCTKLAGYKSKLEQLIIDEAEHSLSYSGSFIIDKLNNNPQSNNIDLGKSEHRNALYIMSQSQFTPLKDNRLP